IARCVRDASADPKRAYAPCLLARHRSLEGACRGPGACRAFGGAVAALSRHLAWTRTIGQEPCARVVGLAGVLPLCDRARPLVQGQPVYGLAGAQNAEEAASSTVAGRSGPACDDRRRRSA